MVLCKADITSKNPKKSALIKGLDKIWYVNDIWHKPYPVGLLMVGPVESVIKICNLHNIQSKDVRSIEIKIYSDATSANWRFGTLRMDIQPDGRR